ncbi:hypothetical protein I308_105731 [Cryptococcus tetragattii IND107]|uniref:Uncharacterized protein n=1 Tax=Cryptococcus tetragattii IND107 TaxID=1296105 RepID=A0ABR3BKZ3_9TREE
MNLGFTASPIIVPEGQAVNRKQETKHNHKQGTNHPETITIKKRQATSSRSDARPQFRERMSCQVHDDSEPSNNRHILPPIPLLTEFFVLRPLAVRCDRRKSL